jgi:multiple sugar transport system permease protein
MSSRSIDHARRAAGGLSAYLLLAVFALANVYPFLWMITGSLKPNNELLGNPSLIPNEWQTGVLLDTWQRFEFFRYFGNSVIYTGASLVGILLIYPLAAFAFAKLEFRGRDPLFAMFLAILLVPGITTLIPMVILIQSLGLINTWPGLILPTINGAAPLAVFLMRNYFRALPSELFDAARLDGASTFATYRRIYLPLSAPAVTTIAILNAITIWNAYIAPSLLISNKEMFTLPLGLFSIRTSAAPEWNTLLAGSLFVVAPLILAFVVFQRYYISGITAGATRD